MLSTSLRHLSLSAALLAGGLFGWVFPALAESPVGNVNDVPGSATTNLRPVIIAILNIVLSFLALVAVIMIIIAGIRMIVSQGEQEQTGKARKTIIYAAVGLLIVIIAKAIVNFVINLTI